MCLVWVGCSWSPSNWTARWLRYCLLWGISLRQTWASKTRPRYRIHSSILSHTYHILPLNWYLDVFHRSTLAWTWISSLKGSVLTSEFNLKIVRGDGCFEAADENVLVSGWRPVGGRAGETSLSWLEWLNRNSDGDSIVICRSARYMHYKRSLGLFITIERAMQSLCVNSTYIKSIQMSGAWSPLVTIGSHSVPMIASIQKEISLRYAFRMLLKERLYDV